MRPPCYDLRKGPRNTATPGRLPMMHVPEVGKRGCASVLCYLPRHTTTTTLVCRYVRPGRDSIVFMSLAGRSPRPPARRRKRRGTSKFRGTTVRCGAQIRKWWKIFDGRSVISAVMPNQSSSRGIV